jgi:hypothetical protein
MRETVYPDCGRPVIQNAGNQLSGPRETGIHAAGNQIFRLRETSYPGNGKPAILTEDLSDLPHLLYADNGGITLIRPCQFHTISFRINSLLTILQFDAIF